MTRLDSLYLEHGQSAWVDNIRRDWIEDGTLQDLVDRGVRGVTSNPSIFAKALSTTTAYDSLVGALGLSDPEQAFEALAVSDVRDASAILRKVFDASQREFAAGTRLSTDGYVSLEVSPRLAHDTDGTVRAAVRLADELRDSPNVMIKIPATPAGLPAISEALSRGINVNVTLIFSLARYRDVLSAYVEGLQRAQDRGLDISGIASVASFFISRVDSAVDPLLPADATLRGEIANSQAAAAYEIFLEHANSEPMLSLRGIGAQVQRPLWASTSTKNPAYDDLLYVDTLVAPHTVNTMPDPTLEIYAQRGDASRSRLADSTLRRSLREAIDQLGDYNINLDKVTQQLEDEGVAAFMASYDDVLATVSSKLP